MPTVERNAKFPSNQMVAGQFIAENATANEDHHEDIKLTSNLRFKNNFLFFFLFFVYCLFTLKKCEYFINVKTK